MANNVTFSPEPAPNADLLCSQCEKVGKEMILPLLEAHRTGSQDAFNTHSLLLGTVGEIADRKLTCPSCKDLDREMARYIPRGWNARPNHDIVLTIHYPTYPKHEQEEQTREDGHAHLPLKMALKMDAQIRNNAYARVPFTMSLRAMGPERKGGDWLYYFAKDAPLEEGGPVDSRGKLIDPRAVDIDLLRYWMKRCQETHGDICHARPVRFPPQACPDGILLVDLEGFNLCHSSLDQRYAALSYVWGNANNLRTTTASLPRHLESGSLDFHSGDMYIPETIRDFLRLAKKLGFDYAWVDSLCVVQDGPGLTEQLDGMAAIYASASLTIVATDPSADYGLPGTGGGARERETPCFQFRLPNDTFYRSFGENPSWQSLGTWVNRTWTLQEELFSRRKIFFGNGSITMWECGSALWGEPQWHNSETTDPIFTAPLYRHQVWDYGFFKHLKSRWPDLRIWCKIVEEYGVRELSFESDGLKALAGTVLALSNITPGGFFFGIPEFFFDVFLLWDATEGWISERRDMTGPSWSFFGWKSGKTHRMDLFWWRNTMDHNALLDNGDGFGSDIVVESIVEWFKKSESQGRVAIRNEYHVCRSTWAKEPPAGWTKHEADNTDRPYYTHESVKDWKFGYPVPISEGNPSPTNLNPADLSNYLFFRTKRTWLAIGKEVPTDFKNFYKNYIPRPPTYPESQRHRALLNMSLVDSSGDWVGIIRLPGDEANAARENDSRLELIAVARAKIANDRVPKKPRVPSVIRISIPEWNCEERLSPSELSDPFYEVYFVLCIEWKDGIAYRRGLGRVKRAAWERQDLQDVDVVLG
ncbi:heterokaryon incompatibility protein-domain-containing protein [Podospora conica]|nr:heterokaryon incompatibility protein-domain-containing protein [Schizothecium conicum]